MNKKTLTTKIIKDSNNYLQKIKPKSSKNLLENDIIITQDIARWLIIWQECFLNTIIQNTNHYREKQKEYEEWKKDKPLTNTAQIEKISTHLSIPYDVLIIHIFPTLKQK